MSKLPKVDSYRGVSAYGVDLLFNIQNNALALAFLLAALLPATGMASSAATLGYNYHAGPADNSISGASSYSGIISSEGGEKAFRITYGIGGHYSSCLLQLQSQEYTATIFGGEMRLGLSFHALAENFFSPIFSVKGVFGANVYKLLSPPSSASNNEMSFQYGYEGESGMSLKFGRKRLRLTGAYRWIKSRYNSTQIALNAMSFRVGVEF